MNVETIDHVTDISSYSFCNTVLIKTKECYVPQRNVACQHMQIVLHLFIQKGRA